MGTLKLNDGAVEYQWTTDVAFDGLRLEIISTEGDMLFDVSIPEGGPITVNTFGKEVPADIVLLAIETARGSR